jgi:hypothetical protein
MSLAVLLRGRDMEHTQIRPVFAHRRNDDATIDSICRNCFLVVGRAFKKGDLEYLELRHVCQAVEAVSPSELFTEFFLSVIKNDCCPIFPSQHRLRQNFYGISLLPSQDVSVG